MNYKFLDPNYKEIDIKRARKLDIVYPDRKNHNIIAEYVQKTKDGKYVLSYLEFYKEELLESFTELNYIDGEWSKNPFHLDYDEYEFEPFDKELSDSVIAQLPKRLFFKIQIKSDSKDKVEVPKEEVVEEKVVSTGAQVIKSHDEKNLYMVLPVNEGESVIDKSNFNFDFPFPVFSLLGNTTHDINYNNSRDDINYEHRYEEEMYLRDELSVTTRRVVKEYLENDTETKFDLRELPILEVDGNDGQKNICFISCPNIDLYNDIYKADKLFVDSDMPTSYTYDSKIESSMHGEVPLAIVLINGDTKDNGVKHSTTIKELNK
jgi:hypothetical protein